jgi:predicted nucleotidyltransferase
MRASEFIKESFDYVDEEDLVNDILNVLPIAQEIWFHGSRATGTHHDESDTDILVILPDDISVDDRISAIHTLQRLAKRGIYSGFDIQPASSDNQIARIAREEGQLLWAKDQQINELDFLGSQCTKDCSGHRAGYAWSKRKGTVPASRSPSFNKGAALQAAGK